MALERSSEMSGKEAPEQGPGILGWNPNSIENLVYDLGLTTVRASFPEASPAFCATRHLCSPLAQHSAHGIEEAASPSP